MFTNAPASQAREGNTIVKDPTACFKCYSVLFWIPTQIKQQSTKENYKNVNILTRVRM